MLFEFPNPVHFIEVVTQNNRVGDWKFDRFEVICEADCSKHTYQYCTQIVKCFQTQCARERERIVENPCFICGFVFVNRFMRLQYNQRNCEHNFTKNCVAQFVLVNLHVSTIVLLILYLMPSYSGSN